MKKRLLLMLLLVIGVASVTTVLYVNRTFGLSDTKETPNNIDEKEEDYCLNGSFNVGDLVKIGNQEFYVMEDDCSKSYITLLSKFNLNLENYLQEDATEHKYMTLFTDALDLYWKDMGAKDTATDFDIVDENPSENHYAAYIAYKYGEIIGGNSRLPYYDELKILNKVNSDLVYGKYAVDGYLTYWTGTVTSQGDFIKAVSETINSESPFSNAPTTIEYRRYGVRPVVETLRSLVQKVE